MNIRPAEARDLDDLVAMHALLQEHLERANTRLWAPPAGAAAEWRGMYEQRMASDSGIVLVAEEDGRVIGSIAAGVDRRPGSKPAVVGHIQTAFVRDEWRGRGVGTALVGAVLEFFESHDVEDISLRYIEGNHGATRFWRRLGFEPLIQTANASPEEVRHRLSRRHGRQQT